MSTESDTPRTDRAGKDGLYSTMVIHALRLERELNEVTAERDNLNASLTAAISSSNARHFESMEYEAKSKQLEIKLNEMRKDLKRALYWIDDGVDQEGRDLIVNPMKAKYFADEN